MDVHTNIPLSTLTTMQLGGPAKYVADVHTVQELHNLYQNAQKNQIPVFVLGGGSNVIARDEGFNGLILRMRIPGFNIVADDIYSTTITIGAGELWDNTVKRTVDMRLTGIEALSAIPGTVGAAPVQNIGAYGQEVADTLVSLEAYDTQTQQIVSLQHADCGFAYRQSMFRGEAMGRYIITSVTLKLSKNLPTAPFYDSLQAYFDEHAISVFTQQILRDAVIAIRANKLPDPKTRPNAGSFFKNAIIESWQFKDLKVQFPDIIAYDMADDTKKVSTGWLIEKAGYKGKLIHGIRVNESNVLVLINESASSYADLAAARDEISNKIRDMFRIYIEQEPLEIPT